MAADGSSSSRIVPFALRPKPSATYGLRVMYSSETTGMYDIKPSAPKLNLTFSCGNCQKVNLIEFKAEDYFRHEFKCTQCRQDGRFSYIEDLKPVNFCLTMGLYGNFQYVSHVITPEDVLWGANTVENNSASMFAFSTDQSGYYDLDARTRSSLRARGYPSTGIGATDLFLKFEKII